MGHQQQVERYRAGLCAVCGAEPLEQPEYPDHGYRTVLGPKCRGKKIVGSFAYNIWLGMRFAGLRDDEPPGQGPPPPDNTWAPPMLSDVFLGGPEDVPATEENVRALREQRRADAEAGRPWTR